MVRERERDSCLFLHCKKEKDREMGWPRGQIAEVSIGAGCLRGSWRSATCVHKDKQWTCLPKLSRYCPYIGPTADTYTMERNSFQTCVCNPNAWSRSLVTLLPNLLESIQLATFTSFDTLVFFKHITLKRTRNTSSFVSLPQLSGTCRFNSSQTLENRKGVRACECPPRKIGQT